MLPSDTHSNTDALTSLDEPSDAEANMQSRTERPAASRAHDAVLALGRRAIAAPDPNVLIDDAARLIAEIAGTNLALIARGETGTRQTLVPITSGADPSTQDLASEGTSLANYAIDEAHPIVVPDLLNSNLYSDRYLEHNNIRGALIVPLRLQNA